MGKTTMQNIWKTVIYTSILLYCICWEPVTSNDARPTIDEAKIHFPIAHTTIKNNDVGEISNTSASDFNHPTLENHVKSEDASHRNDESQIGTMNDALVGGNTKSQHSMNNGDHADAGPHGELHENHDEGHHGIHLASWRWSEYSVYLAFILMIISAGVLKLLFHHCHCLSAYFPESCVLILIGIVVGLGVEYGIEESQQQHFPKFTAELFFHILLPPIILDAAYAIYDPEFLSNLGSVLIFAVAGTLFNVFTIGYGLYFVSFIGAIGPFPSTMINDTIGHNHLTLKENLTAVECLTFSSLISAVDPVAVLAIFEDIGVNRGLYFLVFGESLLNDGVTVVLYNSMVSLGNIGENVSAMDYVMVFFSFFTVVFGGFTIGIIIGYITSYIVKFTKQTRVIEPLIIFALSYLSYILAETIHWSGIISLIGCGFIQKRYAFRNISRKSHTTVKYATKTLAAFSDCIIFLFLGFVTVKPDHVWHTGFTLWTCFFCSIFRFASVYFLSYIINRTRVKPITVKEQFIMAYGGLRGAVGFSLVEILSDDNPFKQMFLTTTIFMVFFTVFIQGGTIKFLVNKLKIKKHESGVSTINNL